MRIAARVFSGDLQEADELIELPGLPLLSWPEGSLTDAGEEGREDRAVSPPSQLQRSNVRDPHAKGVRESVIDIQELCHQKGLARGVGMAAEGLARP
jgi:hypothetical protein